jgi:two-component system OmpR family response regulator
VTHPGQTLSRDDLSELSKGYISGPFNRSLDTQVSRLRRKLRPEGPAPEMTIRTVWGRGYLFAAEVEIE